MVNEASSYWDSTVHVEWKRRIFPSRPWYYKTFFHAQLSMKFFLLINRKMPTIVGIFIFISREISCSAMFSKKEFGIVSNLRFINMKKCHAQLSWAWKSFITSGPDFQMNSISYKNAYASREDSDQPAFPRSLFSSVQGTLWVVKDPSVLKRTAKTQIRLHGWAGWSESSLITLRGWTGWSESSLAAHTIL